MSSILHRHVRPALASLLSLGAAEALRQSVGRDWYMLALPLALLVLSSFLIHRASLAPQLLSRAVWWANLALGAMLSTSHSHTERGAGAMLGLLTGAALLVVGRKALGEASTNAGYVPAALRSVLMLLMLLALADAQTFLLFGSVGVIDGLETGHFGELGQLLLFLAFGSGYAIGFVGLYRLRVWGALLNAAVSIGVLGMVFFSKTLYSSEIAIFLGLLATAHIVVALPVALTTLIGKNLPSLSPRTRGIAATLVVALLMLMSLSLGLS